MMMMMMMMMLMQYFVAMMIVFVAEICLVPMTVPPLMDTETPATKKGCMPL
jgi:hypothetical protein